MRNMLKRYTGFYIIRIASRITFPSHLFSSLRDLGASILSCLTSIFNSHDQVFSAINLKLLVGFSKSFSCMSLSPIPG